MSILPAADYHEGVLRRRADEVFDTLQAVLNVLRHPPFISPLSAGLPKVIPFASLRRLC